MTKRRQRIQQVEPADPPRAHITLLCNGDKWIDTFDGYSHDAALPLGPAVVYRHWDKHTNSERITIDLPAEYRGLMMGEGWNVATNGAQ